MSEYFRVLKRLETEKVRPEEVIHEPPVRGSTTPLPKRTVIAPAEAVQVAPAALLPLPPARTKTAAAFAALYDNLRALTDGQTTRSLVFAAAGGGSVQPVTSGLAAHLMQIGSNALIGQLTGGAGRRLLRRLVDSPPGQAAGYRDPLPVDLSGRTESSDISHWVRSAADDSDLVLIEGQPLAESIDSALLARFCDGLVIVAHTEVTSRQALEIAADRARKVGCRTLGLVMYGTKERVPAWMQRFLPTGPWSATMPEV